MNRPYAREITKETSYGSCDASEEKKMYRQFYEVLWQVPQHSTAQATAKRMGKSAFRHEPRLLASLLKETQPLERHRMGTTL